MAITDPRLVLRGSVYFIRYKHADKGWTTRTTHTRDEDEAEQTLRMFKKSNGWARRPVALLNITLEEAANRWLESRRPLDMPDWANQRAHLHRYVLPALGDFFVGDVRPAEVRGFVRSLHGARRVDGKGPGGGQGRLAPRTIRNIYRTLHSMFASFVADELVDVSPCQVRPGDLPPIVDRDPSWRAGAMLSRDEVELLIGDDRIPADRRMLYGLLLLTGCRLGEGVALRFEDIDYRKRPLQQLAISKSYDRPTKTRTTRLVPIHPVLTDMFTSWKRKGFRVLMGRKPNGDDLIVPEHGGLMRKRYNVRTRYLQDLASLGLRHRRVHDCRRSFITLARDAGARPDVLRLVTHSPRHTVIDLYTSWSWAALCEAVSCLEVAGHRRPKKRRR